MDTILTWPQAFAIVGVAVASAAVVITMIRHM
jgi:hypothetical protein